MGKNIYGPPMAKNIYGPPMAKNIYGPQMAKNIYGPPMAQNTYALFKMKRGDKQNFLKMQATKVMPRSASLTLLALKNTWNVRRLVNESFVPSAQQTSVLYCRLSDFNILFHFFRTRKARKKAYVTHG